MAVKESKIRVMISIEKELHEKIKEFAELDRRSISNYITIAVEKYIKENEKND